MRSCSIRFTPARRLSERSDLSVTLWFVFVASLNASMVAARATSVMPMATINSISVNPDCLFMISSLPPSSRKRRDIADERVSAFNTADLIVNRDSDLPQIRFCGYGCNGNRARHPWIQIDDDVIGSARFSARAGPDNDGIRKGRVVIRGAHQSVRAGVKQRLGTVDKHAVGRNVLNLRPSQNLGIARRENRFYGLFGLLFRDVVILRKAGIHDALCVDRRQRKHTEGKNDDGNHRLDQREAGWMTRDFALSFH